MSEKNKIGAKVKLVRENRKLSIEDVSERTNLSVEQIASIEDGSLVPNLTPLIKIARVLGVRLGTFMDDDENLGPVVTRAADKKEVTRFSDRGNAVNSDLDFYTLAQNKAGRHMDPFIIDIFPSSEEEIKTSTHEGEEFIYVLEGEVEIIYGKDNYELKQGDSIYYESIVAHHVHSHGENKAKILAVVYTPAWYMDDREYYSLMNRSSSWALQQALKKKSSTKKTPSAQNAVDGVNSYSTLEARQGRADAEMLLEKKSD